MRPVNSKSCISKGKVLSTDPPYYDNIGYADLSDFFYVWLRRSLKDNLSRPLRDSCRAKVRRSWWRRLIGTMVSASGEAFFLEGMTQAMSRLAQQTHPTFPVSIFYAFRQAENQRIKGVVSTGWETFLGAVIGSGFSITGTWPVRTEGSGRILAKGTNALASSIVLVCRRRPDDAPKATRGEFLNALYATSYRRRCGCCKRATSPPSISPRRRSGRAWRHTPATRSCRAGQFAMSISFSALPPAIAPAKCHARRFDLRRC